MNIFIGLDVSLATTAVCVLSEHGKVEKEAKVVSEPEALAAFLNSMSGSVVVVGLEAGPLSQWLHVTSRQVIWLLLKQLWFEFVPVFHGLQGRLAAQG